MYSIRFGPISPNGTVTFVILKQTDQWLVIKNKWNNLLSSLRENKDKQNENYICELIVEDYTYYRLIHYAKCKIYCDAKCKWFQCKTLKSAWHYAHKYSRQGNNVFIYNKFGKFVGKVQALYVRKDTQLILYNHQQTSLIIHPERAIPQFIW